MRFVVTCFAMLALAACGGSDAPSGLSGGGVALGEYTLKSVDGIMTPAAFTDSTVLSGKLTFTDDGWSQLTVVHYAVGGSETGDTLTLSGEWEASGTSLTLYDHGFTTQYVGSFSPTTIDIRNSAQSVLSYER
ncbi:MAG TPA: hypothetical protein VFP90_17740 [Gemmatimonadaceae bacterium]|nr:hypothetical protein [Gemmatimonadaceae bacterium]